MKRILIFLAITVCSTAVQAQQHALYSQYIFNLFIVNPAYAGARDALALNAGYRTQWVGFEGAPKTQNFTMHAPLRNKQMSLGLQIQNDQIGARSATTFSGTYAYALQLGKARKLSFGLQAGMINYNTDWNALTYYERFDPAAFATNPNQWIPNFDFGVMYLTPRAYLGASATNLNRPGLSGESGSDARLQTHIQLMGGKVFEVSETLSLKPNFFVRHAVGGPVQFDLSMAGLFYNTVWFTTTYRNGFGMVASTHIYLSEKFHFGYAYDWAMGSMAGFQSGSHEIFIGYDLPIYKAKRLSPRYF